jgi:hypothetical protein
MTECLRRAPGSTDAERVANHLRARYSAIVDRYPLFRDAVAEATYIRVNRRPALRALRGDCWHTRTMEGTER